MIDTTLDTLFDFQRIAHNARLDTIIEKTERHSSYALTEEELMMVAGGAEVSREPKGTLTDGPSSTFLVTHDAAQAAGYR